MASAKSLPALDLPAVHPGSDRLRRLQMRNQVLEESGGFVDVLLGVAQEYGYGNFVPRSCPSRNRQISTTIVRSSEATVSFVKARIKLVDSQILMKGPGAFAELHRQKAMTDLPCIAWQCRPRRPPMTFVRRELSLRRPSHRPRGRLRRCFQPDQDRVRSAARLVPSSTNSTVGTARPGNAESAFSARCSINAVSAPLATPGGRSNAREAAASHSSL